MSRSMMKLLLPGLLWPILAGAEMDAGWQLRVRNWEDSGFKENGSKPISRTEYAAGYRWQAGEVKLGAYYAHQPVLVRDGEPAHNGYFHQLDIQALRGYAGTKVRIEAGIHGSSNMFKYGDFHCGAAILHFSVLHPVKSIDAHIGLGGDHRFGQFKLYPRFRREYELRQNSKITFDLPIAIAWHNEKWRVGIEKYGNKWAALDKEREVESAFYLQEWRLNGRRQTDSGIYVEMGYSFDTQVIYRDLFAGRREEDLSDSFYLALGLQTF